MSDLIILEFLLFNQVEGDKKKKKSFLSPARKVPGLIIDPADRKQLKRSQTHEEL